MIMGQYSEDFILTGKNEKAVFSLKSSDLFI